MNWRWIAITASLAALVAVYGALVDRDTASDVADQAVPPPGYYLKDAIITQTQENGSPDMRLAASRIDQQRKDNSIQLQNVKVDYLKVPERHWILTAQRGLVPENSRTVEFSGDVELRPAEAQQQTFLRAESLAVDTVRNVAYTTASPTLIKFGTYSMTVKHLEADLTSEKIKLQAAHGKSGP
jgi:lipopolysaccharide export system protein LptC